MEKDELIICLGPICSGKTTWSLNYLNRYPNVYRFCYDEFLYMCKGNGMCNTEVTKTAVHTIMNFLAKGTVVLDGFPLHIAAIKQLLEFAQSSQIRLFDVSFADSVIRSINRKQSNERFVDMDEMKRYYRMYKMFIKSAKFAELTSLSNVIITEVVDANLSLVM